MTLLQRSAIIQWLRDELKLIPDSKSSEEFALKVKDTNIKLEKLERLKSEFISIVSLLALSVIILYEGMYIAQFYYLFQSFLIP